MNYQDLKRNRSDLRLVTVYLTGHGPFKMHLRRLQLATDTSCRFCGSEEECEAMAYKRYQILGKRFPTITDYNNFNLDILLKYIKNINFIIGV